MEKLKEILTGEAKDLRVLDIGTGLGFFIEILQESLPGYSSIVGIDTKQEVLDKAAAKFQDERIKFRCMDGEHLEFENHSIDLVSLSNTLHHLPNKEKVLSEIKRLLKPGGIVLINEMICDNQSEKQLSHVELHHFQGEIDTLLGICHNRTYTLKELLKIVDDASFERVQMFQYNTHEEQLRSENLEEEKITLDQCFEAMEAKLQKISDKNLKEVYLKRVQKMKERLYAVGFFTATEVMIVCRG